MMSSRPGRAVSHLKRIKPAAGQSRRMAALRGGARNRPILGSIPICGSGCDQPNPVEILLGPGFVFDLLRNDPTIWALKLQSVSQGNSIQACAGEHPFVQCPLEFLRRDDSGQTI